MFLSVAIELPPLLNQWAHLTNQPLPRAMCLQEQLPLIGGTAAPVVSAEEAPMELTAGLAAVAQVVREAVPADLMESIVVLDGEQLSEVRQFPGMMGLFSSRYHRIGFHSP